MKHALALDYNIIGEGILSRWSFELASPLLGFSGRGDPAQRSAEYAKIDIRHQ